MPDVCLFTVDRRTNPTRTWRPRERRLLELIDPQAAGGRETSVTVIQEVRVVVLGHGSALGRTLADAVTVVTGEPPVAEMCPGLLETRFYAARGVPLMPTVPACSRSSHGPKRVREIDRSHGGVREDLRARGRRHAGGGFVNFDQQVRLAIYEMTVNDGRIPSIDELAESRHVDRERVAAAYRALADAHVIVLKPGTTDIWSAPPFSAVPTAFRVNPAKPGRSDAGRWWYAPCAWDAFGVPAVVRHDVHTSRQMRDNGRAAAVAACRTARHSAAASSTSKSRPGISGTTSSTPERTSCSSGRKRRSIRWCAARHARARRDA